MVDREDPRRGTPHPGNVPPQTGSDLGAARGPVPGAAGQQQGGQDQRPRATDPARLDDVAREAKDTVVDVAATGRDRASDMPRSAAEAVDARRDQAANAIDTAADQLNVRRHLSRFPSSPSPDRL